MAVPVPRKEGTWVTNMLVNPSTRFTLTKAITTSITVKNHQASVIARSEITSILPQCLAVKRTKAKRKKGQSMVKSPDSPMAITYLISLASQA